MAREESTLPGGTRISDLVALGALSEFVSDAQLEVALESAGIKPGRHRLLPPDVTALYVIALAVSKCLL